MMLSDVSDVSLSLSLSLSDVCLSVAYIGPKSGTDRPRKIKIGTEVVHITQGQKVKGQLAGSSILWQSPAHLVHWQNDCPLVTL